MAANGCARPGIASRPQLHHASNIGARFIQKKGTGASRASSEPRGETMEELVMPQVRTPFNPELSIVLTRSHFGQLL